MLEFIKKTPNKKNIYKHRIKQIPHTSNQFINTKFNMSIIKIMVDILFRLGQICLNYFIECTINAYTYLLRICFELVISFISAAKNSC